MSFFSRILCNSLPSFCECKQPCTLFARLRASDVCVWFFFGTREKRTENISIAICNAFTVMRANTRKHLLTSSKRQMCVYFNESKFIAAVFCALSLCINAFFSSLCSNEIAIALNLMASFLVVHIFHFILCAHFSFASLKWMNAI